MFDGPDGFDLTCRTGAAALRPKHPLTPSQWAEAKRRLSTKSSAEAARWRNSRIPFLRPIMDALDTSFPAWMVVFIKSSQVGATECGLNWVGQTIEEDPAPMLALFPGEKLGKRWARKRLEPMIAECASLRKIIPLGRRSDKSDTLLEKEFPDGGLTIGSANIPSDMASIAVAKLLLDEVDRFPKEVGEEGDPVEIVLRRLSTYQSRKKAFLNSSPTIASLSHIKPWWLESSQGEFYVPCPHCNAMQVLAWGNIKYPEGRPREAQYMCNECAALIHEHHKTDMLAAGEFRHAFPERTESIIGFHVNCLYTPLGLGDTWGENAVVWERAKRDPGKIKTFVNTRLGETHEDPTEKLDWEALKERREPFKLRTIQPGVLLLTAGVDVQKDRVEAQIIGWARGEKAWTVDYRVIPGDPTRDELWNALDAYLAREFESAHGVPMRLSSTLIDSGYLQDDVLAFTRERRARGIFASKGATAFGRQAIGRPTKVDVSYRGKAQKYGGEQYQIGVSTLKATLYERLRADADVMASARHVHFSDELPEEFYRGLAAEVFDPHKRRWVKVYERNEPLDTMILAMAAAMHHSVAMHTFGESDWVRLEQLYEPAEKREIAPAEFVLPGTGFMPTAAVRR